MYFLVFMGWQLFGRGVIIEEYRDTCSSLLNGSIRVFVILSVGFSLRFSGVRVLVGVYIFLCALLPCRLFC